MTLLKKKLLVGSHYSLCTALAVFGFCAAVANEAIQYQASAREQLRKLSSAVVSLSTPTNAVGASALAPSPENRGIALVGRVDVPRVRLSAMIADGDAAGVLSLAVGHVPGTALPGQAGNAALVAHRDTFFRRLGELQPGDLIRVTTPLREYSYSVTFTDIVNPDETWVLQAASGETLTLITCYPFHFLGPAPRRFVVRAHRLDPR